MLLPCAALAFRPLLDLPDAWSEAARDSLADDEETARYAAVLHALRLSGIRSDAAFHCGFGKLLGWPALVQQYDLDVTNGTGSDAQRLLLQLDSYANGKDSVVWGPGGSLYFMIGERDLRRGHFSDCDFVMQTT